MLRCDVLTLFDSGEQCEIMGRRFISGALANYLGCFCVFLLLNVAQSCFAVTLAHCSSAELKNLVRSLEVPVCSFCVTLDAEVTFTELP